MQTNNGTDERAGLPSASSFYRYQLCSGSYQMEQKAREMGTVAHEGSEAATCGEQIHKWLAGEPAKLNPEDLETAIFLQERANDQIRRIFGEEKLTVLKEERLWLKGRLSGRFDLLAYSQERALIQDFKTGRSIPLAAEQSAQMKVLAVLVAIALPQLEEVYVQIISRNQGVTEARYGVADLEQAYNEIVSVLRELESPQATLKPGPEQCRYCPAILICPAVREAMPLAAQEISSLPPDGPKAAEILDLVAILENQFAEVRKHYAKILQERADAIPGYAMVPGPPKRVISDWEAASARLGEYLEPVIVKEAQSFRLGQLETALGDKLGLSQKDARARFNQLLEGLIEWKTPAPTLKRVKEEAL